MECIRRWVCPDVSGKGHVCSLARAECEFESIVTQRPCFHVLQQSLSRTFWTRIEDLTVTRVNQHATQSRVQGVKTPDSDLQFCF